MFKRNTTNKRFVDYVFLAGLPTGFRVNPKKQKSTTDQSSFLKDEGVKENFMQGQSDSKGESTKQFNFMKKNVVNQMTKVDDITMKDIDTTSLDTTTSTSNSISVLSNNTTTRTSTSTSDFDGNVPETFNTSRKLLNSAIELDFVANDEESKELFDSLFENIKMKILNFDQERDEFLKSIRKDFRKSDIWKDVGSKHKSGFKYLDEGFLETDSIKSYSSNDTSDNTLKAQQEPRISYQNVAPQQPSSKQNVISPETLSHPLKQKFSPKLLSRYPRNDYPKEGAFPAYVPMFCFPNDIMIRESETCPTPTFHGFMMTQEDGSQRYGVCLTMFEPISGDLFEELKEQQNSWREANMTSSEIEYAENLNEKIRAEKKRLEIARAKVSLQRKDGNSKELEEIADAKEKLELFEELLQPIKLGVLNKCNLWVPKCIGIISHLPWHDVLKDWLCVVAMPMIEGLKERDDSAKSLIPLERHIVNLVHEIPLPPPGKLQVAISVNELTFFCARPALNQVSTMKDFSLYPLFRSLSIKNIITLFEAALAERKILLISSYPDMLYLVAHSITYLIYPFYWQGVFIPVLPARLMACLQAPVPYIMGIERQYKGIDLLPEDACIVDIDKDTILMAELPTPIPSRQRKKLIQSLEVHSPLRTRYCVPSGVPVFIQQAYPNGRFTPMSNKSKIYDKTGRNKMIGSAVVGAPAKAIPVVPFMTSSFDPENGLIKLNSCGDNSRINQALQLVPMCNESSNHSNPSSIGDTSGNNRNVGFATVTAATIRNKHMISGNMDIPNNNNSSHSLPRRFANFVSPDKPENVKNVDKFGKKTKQKFSALTGVAINSITVLKNKTLTKNGVFSRNKLGWDPRNNSSTDFAINTQPSPASTGSLLFDDGLNSPDDILKEGHVMALLSSDNEAYGRKNVFSVWMMEGLACSICRESLGASPVYKCEGCSMMIHDECLADVVYPCPACFDESKIIDAFLRVFASLLKNYRSYLNNDDTTSNIFENGFCVDESFKKDLFLKNFDKDKDAKAFLSDLLDSQSFSHFISERVTKTSEDYEIRYFDEVIKTKLNRSKLKLSKESTTFLDDASFHVSQTIRAMKPNNKNLDGLGFKSYVGLPDRFDPELMSIPRPVRDGWANGFGKGWR